MAKKLPYTLVRDVCVWPSTHTRISGISSIISVVYQCKVNKKAVDPLARAPEAEHCTDVPIDCTRLDKQDAQIKNEQHKVHESHERVVAGAPAGACGRGAARVGR